MGGFFAIASTEDCITDVFFGTDYHSHLGTRLGGMASINENTGFQRVIHTIEISPFRTKFENISKELQGKSALGCISDSDPQPLIIRSAHGVYAICVTGKINNSSQLSTMVLDLQGGHFEAMSSGQINQSELVAALISQKESLIEGICFAQKLIDGTATILILKEDGSIIAARDKLGRLPVHIGQREDAKAASFESFALCKMGFDLVYELGPGEIVEVTSKDITQLVPPGPKMKICAFLWSYYGYPTTSYEGQNVEMMRYRNGQLMALEDKKRGLDLSSIDYVGGVPDSGTPHAIGYSNESQLPFARAFIKYTPTWSRSFMPVNQSERNKVAKMKQIPVMELIKDKNLLFVDDSIVRGTQLKETVDFLYNCGAKSVHMRSACPPIMYPCKFINFSRSNSPMDLISRQIIVELEGEEGLKHIADYSDGNTQRGKALRLAICKKLHFTSLEFQSLEGVIEAIGIDRCKLCTYCWTGEE